VATINIFDDNDGIISDYNRNFQLLNVNSLEEVTILGNRILAMLENIMSALGVNNDHYGETFHSFRDSSKILLGQLDNTPQKFIKNS